MKLVADFILIIGILLASLALIGLFRLKQKRLPQYILTIFWLLILGVIINFYARLHELEILVFITNYIEDGVRFFIPPLVFLYLKSIFLAKTNLIKSNLFHFLPFAIYFLSYTIPKSLNSNLLHITLIDQYIDWALVQDIYGIVYFLLSLKLFYQISKTLKQNYSNINEKDFLWIEKFLLSFLIVLIVDLLITISEISFGYLVTWDGYITIFFMIVAMFYIGYYGLTQATIFLPSFLIQKHLGKTNEQYPQHSYFTKAQIKELKKKFANIMEVEKVYLKADLNLKALADKMEISERKLSAFLNEVLESSFYDTINVHRVEEAKMILRSDLIKNYSITGIGLSCGFSSKSSFYRAFKKNTGLSPSEYRSTALKESHRT